MLKVSSYSRYMAGLWSGSPACEHGSRRAWRPPCCSLTSCRVKSRALSADAPIIPSMQLSSMQSCLHDHSLSDSCIDCFAITDFIENNLLASMLLYFCQHLQHAGKLACFGCSLAHYPAVCVKSQIQQNELAASPTSCMLAEATKCVWLVHFMSARVSGCSSPVGRNPVLPSSSGSGKSRFKSTSPLHDEHD